MDWLAWRERGRVAPYPERLVVVDVEASGLDAARERLLAVAAVALRVDWAAGRLALDAADSFEAVLRQPHASGHDNILLHGIGAQRQLAGEPAADVLRTFRGFVAAAPLLAFHAAFDRKLVGRALRAELGRAPALQWLDIEHLCAATHPRTPARSLDDWLARFGIACMARHDAAADAWAECELMLRIWPRIAAECRDWNAVRRLAGHHRWIGRG